MLYRLFFRDGAGHPLTLSGHKLIEDNAGFDVWRDTTTLFTRVLRGHVDEPARRGRRGRRLRRAAHPGARLRAPAHHLPRPPRARCSSSGPSSSASSPRPTCGRDGGRMPRRKGKRLQAASEAGRKPSGRTHLLGALAGARRARRVRRRADAGSGGSACCRSAARRRPRTRRSTRCERSLMVIREGYAVSRTRENSLFNMLASFSVTFGVTRGITWHIREHGGLGPIQNVVVGHAPHPPLPAGRHHRPHRRRRGDRR